MQVYGGLKDQDRIFTNIYGEQVCKYFYPSRMSKFCFEEECSHKLYTSLPIEFAVYHRTGG